ncbi:MAG: hypothetical protein RBU45_22880 [Myxococcota bacterium]|jgi:hypothetical protein|nr:hypothetical protein [Myxococcota bacterium]
MSDRNDQQAGLQYQQGQQQQQAQGGLEQQQAPPQSAAVASVASFLEGRPSYSALAGMLSQLVAAGRLPPPELAQVRDLVQQACGNDFARRAFAEAGLQPAATPPAVDAPQQVGAAPPPAVTKVPTTLPELKQAGLVRKDFAPGTLSMTLFKALDKYFPDKETVWKILEACNRTELDFLKNAYQQVHGRDLVAHLDDRLNGADLRRAWAPFGKAGDVGETTGEYLARKTSEAGEWVKDKGNQAIEGAKNLYEDGKAGVEVLKDMASVIQDLGLNPLTGEGTVTVDAGKAFFYLRPFLPPHIATMFNIDPAAAAANKVELYVNLPQKRAAMRADQLAVLGMRYPNFFSSSCTLNRVSLQVLHFNPLKPTAGGSNGFATIESATLNRAVFTSTPIDKGGIKAGGMITANQVHLAGLRLNAAAVTTGTKGGPADGLVSQLSFDQAKALGLNYPGLPPVDLEINQVGLNFETLWDALGSQPGATPEGGDPALASAPELFPKGSRIALTLTGVYGAASAAKDPTGKTAATGKAGFQACRIALQQQGGGELASIDIKGFEAFGSGGSAGGTIQSLAVAGNPELVRALLSAKELQANAQVAKAAELIKSYGIEATVGGKASLNNVRFDAKPGAATVKADLAANLVIPEVGNLDLAVKGFSGSKTQDTSEIDFERFEARLKDDRQGSAASLIIEGQAPGQKGAEVDVLPGKTTLQAKKVTASGSSPQLAALSKALRAKAKSLPPALQQVLSLVERYGTALDAQAKIELTDVLVEQGAGGAVSAGANLATKLDIAGVGTVEVRVLGLDVDSQGQATEADFRRFEAKLISAATKQEAASLVVEGDSASKEARLQSGAAGIKAKKASLKGRGADLSSLVRALDGRVGSLPELKGAFATVRKSLPALEALDPSVAMSVTNLSLEGAGDKATARGDVVAKLDAPGVGAVDLKISGYRGNPANPKEMRFDSFEATLTDKSGGQAARFAVIGAKDLSGRPDFGDPKDHLAFAADRVEIKGSAQHLASLLGALERKVPGLSPGAKAAFELARSYGPKLDASLDVLLTKGEVDIDKGQVSAKGSMATTLVLPEVGTLTVGLKGFEGGPGTVNFERFEAKLVDRAGKEAAAVLLEVDPAEAQRVALQGGFPEKVKTARVQGSTQRIALLLKALEDKAGSLPEPIGRTVGQIKRFLGTYQAEGTIDVEQLTILTEQEKTSVSFQVPVGEGSALAKFLKKGSRLVVDLQGWRLPKERVSGGFDALTVKLLGPDGKQVAGLSAKNCSGDLDAGKGTGKIGAFSLEGDGRLLAAAFTDEMLGKLQPGARSALELVKNLRIDASAGTLDPIVGASGGYAGYQGKFADVNFNAGISVTDKQNNVYDCDNAQLNAKSPTIRTDKNFRLQEFTAAKLSGEALLTRRDDGLRAKAKVAGSDAHVVLGPDGRPTHFEVKDIQASGDIETAGGDREQQKNQPADKDAKLAAMKDAQQKAETGANLVRDAEIHTQTPLQPGRYGLGSGELEVPAGASLDADLVIRGRQLIAGANGTRVTFRPSLGGPAWVRVGGAYLEGEGAQGLVKANLKGLWDIDATKMLVGKSKMSLNIGDLVTAVMEHQRAALEKKTPRDEANAEAKKEKNERELAQRHERWEKKRAGEEEDFAEDRADLEADWRKWEEKRDRKIREAGDDNGERIAWEIKDRQRRMEYEEKLRKLEGKKGEEFADLARQEPRAASAAELFGPKGMDPLKTSGTASLTLAAKDAKDTELAPGVMLPGNKAVNLAGVASGSGTVQLSADDVSALIQGQQISAAGLNTGEVQVSQTKTGNRLQFSSFYLRKLDWTAADPKLMDKD